MRSIDIHYTEEEKAFIRKYGENELYYWKRMSESQKQEYQEIEHYYSIFANLLCEHYEDLKLYALMYRNTCLYNCDKDPISVLFFASKQNEIIGFKKRLRADKKSDKVKIAFLYYDNVALFPKAVEKYTEIKINSNQPIIQYIYSSLLKDFKAGSYNHIFSINDLTEIACQKILANRANLKSDYLSLYNVCDEVFTDSYIFTNEKDFIERYFILYILKDNVSFQNSRLLRYVIKKCGEKGIREIKQLKTKYYEYERLYKDKTRELNDNEQNKIQFNNPYGFSYRTEYFSKEREKIYTEYKENLEILISLIKTTKVYNFVRIHRNDIEQYITTSYEKLYNLLWLRKSKYMRKLESQTTGAASIRNIFDEDSKKWRHEKIFAFRKNKKSSKIDFVYRDKEIMKKWCEVIGKENEEIERIRREQELQIFRELEEKKKQETEKKRQEEEARRERFRYNQKNRHYRDADISFDESTHIYKVNGESLQSITNFVKNSFPQFNAEIHAKYQAAKMGKTIKEVLDIWEAKGKESRDLGTALHKKIENYYQGNILNDDDESFKLFKMFADKAKLEPYRTEWSVYDWKHKIAGTIDFVDYQDGEFIIYDWKRSDKLIANEMPVKISLYNEKGNYPLEHLDNSPYYHYALQLSIYKFILERNYDIKVSDLRLGIFHPTYRKPYVIRMPYLEKEINDIFNLRSEVLF